MTEIESLSTQALADIGAAASSDALVARRVSLLGNSGSNTAQL
jgi:phenylalanyl-tRNA synthetase alpha chain